MYLIMYQQRFSDDDALTPLMYTESDDVIDDVNTLNLLLDSLLEVYEDYRSDYIAWRVPQLDDINDSEPPGFKFLEIAFAQDWWKKHFKKLPEKQQAFISAFSIYDFLISGDLPTKFSYKEIESVDFFKARKDFTHERY